MAVAMSTDTAPVAGANDTSVGEPVTPAGATPRGPVTSASYSITVRLTAWARAQAADAKAGRELDLRPPRLRA